MSDEKLLNWGRIISGLLDNYTPIMSGNSSEFKKSHVEAHVLNAAFENMAQFLADDPQLHGWVVIYDR